MTKTQEMSEQSREGSLQEFKDAAASNYNESTTFQGKKSGTTALYKRDHWTAEQTIAMLMGQKNTKFTRVSASFRVVPKGLLKQVVSSNPDRTPHESNDMRFIGRNNSSVKKS